MVMLDAFGLTAKVYGGNHRRSIGYVAATGPFARAIAAGKLEVTGCLQLLCEGIHPCLGEPGGFGSVEQYLVSAFLLRHTVRCHRYLIHRTAGIAGAPVERHGV